MFQESFCDSEERHMIDPLRSTSLTLKQTLIAEIACSRADRSALRLKEVLQKTPDRKECVIRSQGRSAPGRSRRPTSRCRRAKNRPHAYEELRGTIASSGLLLPRPTSAGRRHAQRLFIDDSRGTLDQIQHRTGRYCDTIIITLN